MRASTPSHVTRRWVAIPPRLACHVHPVGRQPPELAGAREIIDRVKAEAPIWKKEIEGGDERWVSGTQPR